MTKLKEHSREICYEQWQSRRAEVVDPLLFVSTPNHHNHGSCYRPAARSLNHPQYHLRTHNIYLTIFVISSQLQYCAHMFSVSQYLVSRRLNLSHSQSHTVLTRTQPTRPSTIPCMSWTTCPLVQLFAVRWSSHCWLNNIQYSICNIARVRHRSHDDTMNQRIFFDSLLWITNVWNQSWIISSPTFVPPLDDETATQRHFPSEAVFFMSMTGQLLDAKLFSCQWFFDAEFLNLRVNIDRFGLRVCAVARIQSLTVIDVRGVLNVYCTRFNCSYALLMHLCPVYIGSTALKVHCDGKYQKGWKKKTSAAVLEFGRLSHYCHTHTHTKICRDYFQVWS